MATHFQSAAKRGYWLGTLYSAAFDFLVAFVIALFFNETAGQALVFGFLILVAFYVAQMLYALLGVAKYSLLFFLFEKKARVAATVDQMNAVKMPKPMQLYLDAEEYLAEVVKNPDAGSDAKLFAGATIGNLEALRSTNHAFLVGTS